MKTMRRIGFSIAVLLALGACTDDESATAQSDLPKKEYGEEWYAGGKMGTVFNATTSAYRRPMPAITADASLHAAFNRGADLFEQSFAPSGDAFGGLGPVYIRKSCIACHPGYGGRSARVGGRFDTTDGRNGYLLMIYDPASPTLALASKYFTGMTQTRAAAPFKAPIDERGITITWHQDYVDEWGNRYPDGMPYSAGEEWEGTLQYPTVEVEQSAILFPDFDMSRHAASIEATIGIYGTGLLDAISDEDLRAEYAAQQARGYCPGVIGPDIEDSAEDNPYYPGIHPGRFTYLCTRGSLDNGPGSNAIWNITNVTRRDRRYNYITEEYARVMARDEEVQRALGESEEAIFARLMSRELPVEMEDGAYEDLLVWHRGLAVPAARNLEDPVVQRGRTIFYEIGCTACHRPSWTTRENYKPLPAISNQKIWPYSDLLRHNLGMKEPGRAGLCRTTPLWGRGLMMRCAGHQDRLHDLRARSTEEAILWHEGEARPTKVKFRNLSREDREALIAFIDAI